MPQVDIWLTRKGAAIFLTRMGCPISKRTLDAMAANNNAGRGPPYTRIGWKVVRYNVADLETWAKSRMVRIE